MGGKIYKSRLRERVVLSGRLQGRPAVPASPCIRVCAVPPLVDPAARSSPCIQVLIPVFPGFAPSFPGVSRPMLQFLVPPSKSCYDRDPQIFPVLSRRPSS